MYVITDNEHCPSTALWPRPHCDQWYGNGRRWLEVVSAMQWKRASRALQREDISLVGLMNAKF